MRRMRKERFVASLEGLFEGKLPPVKIYPPQGYKQKWKSVPHLILTEAGHIEGWPAFNCVVDFDLTMDMESEGTTVSLSVSFETPITFKTGVEVSFVSVDLDEMANKGLPEKNELLAVLLANNCRLDFTVVRGELQLTIGSVLMKGGKPIKAVLAKTALQDLFIKI